MDERSNFDHTLGGFMSVLSVNLEDNGEDAIVQNTLQEIREFSGIIAQQMKDDGDDILSRLHRVYNIYKSSLSLPVHHQGRFEKTDSGKSSQSHLNRVGWADLSSMALVVFQKTMINSIFMTVVGNQKDNNVISMQSSSISLSSADSVHKLLLKLTQLRHKLSALDGSKASIYLTAIPNSHIGDLNALAFANGGLYRFCQYLCQVLGTKRNVNLNFGNDSQILSIQNDESQNQFDVYVRQDWPEDSSHDLRRRASRKREDVQSSKRIIPNPTEETQLSSTLRKENAPNLKHRETNATKSPASSVPDHEPPASSMPSRTTEELTHNWQRTEAQGMQSGTSNGEDDGGSSKPSSRSGLATDKTVSNPQVLTAKDDGKDSKPSSSSKQTSKTKNVYLLGETGQGKSTLANILTESEEFKVSHSGSGTFNLSAKPLHVAEDNPSVLIWDTPGMNDKDGMDSMFQKILLQKIRENGTVSAVVIVSKDGVRVPRTLMDAIRFYRESFGESFMRGLCVCIGINKEKEDSTKWTKKRAVWVRAVKGMLKYDLQPERIFLYNATDEDYQPELERFKKWLAQTEKHLIGVGRTVYQGLSEMRDFKSNTTAKSNVQLASEEALRALRKHVASKELKKIEYDNRGKYGEGLYFSLRPKDKGSRGFVLEVGITALGPAALKLLKSVKWKNKIAGIPKHEQLMNWMKQLDSNAMAFVEKSRKTIPDKRSEIVRIHYILWDMSSEFPNQLSEVVEAAAKA